MKTNFFVESLDQCRRLEVREKARHVFVMSLRLSDHKVVTQHRIFIFSFFRFRSDFVTFFARISCFKFLEFKEFDKTIIPFALVAYETGYSTHGIIVKYIIFRKALLDWRSKLWLSETGAIQFR